MQAITTCWGPVFNSGRKGWGLLQTLQFLNTREGVKMTSRKDWGLQSTSSCRRQFFRPAAGECEQQRQPKPNTPNAEFLSSSTRKGDSRFTWRLFAWTCHITVIFKGKVWSAWSQNCKKNFYNKTFFFQLCHNLTYFTPETIVLYFIFIFRLTE